MDYYWILNVNRDASPAEIKKAYRTLSAKYHPDNSGSDNVGSDNAGSGTNPDAGAKNRELFEQVQMAYAVLGNKEKRAEYDRAGSKADQKANPKNGSAVTPPQGNAYGDLASFFGGQYHEGFERFFGSKPTSPPKSKPNQPERNNPVKTDQLFNSFFKFK